MAVVKFLLLFLFHFNVPTSLREPPHGIIPYFGFDFNIEDKSPPWIDHLLESGVYKIEEVDKNDAGLDTLHSIYSLSLSKYKDSIIVYELKPGYYSHSDRIDTFIYLAKNGNRVLSTGDRIRVINRDERYDSKDRLAERRIEFTMYDNEKSFSKICYNYDTLNFDKVISTYNSDLNNTGKFHLSKVEMEKNDSINRKKEIYYRFNIPDLPNRHEIQYFNNRNLLSKYEDVSDDGTVSMRVEYLYDNDGHLLLKTEYHGDEFYSEEKWKYDDKGRCVQHKDHSTKYEWKYDSKDNIIEYIETDSKATFKNTFKYFYN